MQGKIDVDVTAMTVEKILAWTGSGAFLIALATVCIIVLVRTLKIRNIGPIRLEHQGQSSMFSMNEANRELDDTCRRRMREETGKMKMHISNIFAELRVCALARLAISSTIRYPMYESVANNHFTTELMPERYGAYRERIIEAMMDEYKSLSSASMDINCGHAALPSWDEVGKRLTDCIDLWLKRISREALLCCEKKIGVYQKYLRDFEAIKDDFRAGIAKDCIEKNERYAATLKTRTSRGAL